MSFTSYFLLGLATSLHCVAMCGSFVLTYSVGSGSGVGIVRRLVPQFAYQAAKTLSYAVVALALGALSAAAGRAIDLTAPRNWLMLAAGIYMVLLGLGMSGWVPWLRRLSPRAPAFLVRALSRVRRRAIDDSGAGESHLITPVSFGLLTGLMPCAPLIAAQLGAMSSGSPLTGAWLMLAFGLGTAPLMIAFGLASGLASGVLRERMQYAAAAAVIIFGLVIANRGLMAVGSPVTFDSVRQAVVGTAPAGSPTWREVGGTVEVDLVIKDTRFVPETVGIPAGRPVRLIVDRREDNACSAQLAVPQMGVLKDLAPFAKTTVDLPASAAGSYTLTCGMGMMSGRIVAGSGAPTTGPPWGLVAAVGALAAGALAAVVLRRKGDDADEGSGARVVLGFTLAEVLAVTAAVLLAVLAGLYAGGGFSGP